MSTVPSLAALSSSNFGSKSFLVRSPSSRQIFDIAVPDALCITIVVLGASGDLAKKKTYPALFKLHSKGFLPENVQIVGYARSLMSAEDLREKIRAFLKGPEDQIDAFLKTMTYISGQYDGDEGFMKLGEALAARESRFSQAPNGRIYYLALPPSVYPQVCAGLKKHCGSVTNGTHFKSFLRIVIEKPFGRDFNSAEKLSEELGQLFLEEQMYRIDHYLGKELTQNLMVMRFANCLFECWWNRNFISNVQITFKEDFGVEGRAGYFDEFGIIRDVIQNHLLQVHSLFTTPTFITSVCFQLLTLVAMEKPISLHPDDIRDEKLKVLRCIDPVEEDYCVVGQYAGNRDHHGYLQDETVPPNSKTPTFASCVLYVHNDRWDGVPFILKAGKALNERKSEIRIQLKNPPATLFPNEHDRNELVMRLQPKEAIYMKMFVKKPGLESEAVMSELDLSYDLRYKETNIPDAYERLILDVVRGDQQHFVRRDELAAAWKIFSPLLEKIDNDLITPETYFYGSRGPKAADQLLATVGHKRSSKYMWKEES